MENIKNTPDPIATAATPPKSYEKVKAYQDFINVLSQIIEKHGAEVLEESIMISKRAVLMD